MRYHDLIDRMDGYQIGTIVVENGRAVLHREKGGSLPLETAKTIEVLNGDHYESVTYADCLRQTSEGWPLLAGLYARVILAI
jgi:hypothetical protein